MRLMRTIPVLLATTLTLGVTACGSDSTASDSAKQAADSIKKQIDDATKNLGKGSLPSGTTKQHEFKKASGVKVRVVNLYHDDAKATDIDVYWGSGSYGGKKAATVKYGEVSDFMDGQYEANPLLTPADGSTEMTLSFYLPGSTAQADQLISQDEKVEQGLQLTYVVSTGEAFSGSTMKHAPGSVGVSFEHTLKAPPDGKANIFFDDAGIQAIKDGNFMVPHPVGKCDDFHQNNDGESPNYGSVYEIDPGSYQVAASDANTDCAASIDAIPIDVTAGDSWVIFAYGTTKDDRKLMSLKLEHA